MSTLTTIPTQREPEPGVAPDATVEQSGVTMGENAGYAHAQGMCTVTSHLRTRISFRNGLLLTRCTTCDTQQWSDESGTISRDDAHAALAALDKELGLIRMPRTGQSSPQARGARFTQELTRRLTEPAINLAATPDAAPETPVKAAPAPERQAALSKLASATTAPTATGGVLRLDADLLKSLLASHS